MSEIFETNAPTSLADKKEHITVGSTSAKRTLLAGYDGSAINDAYVDSNGNLVVTTGLSIPKHDTQVIDESLAPATTVITYKTGGTGGTTVATKTITVSGTTTNIVVT